MDFQNLHFCSSARVPGKLGFGLLEWTETEKTPQKTKQAIEVKGGTVDDVERLILADEA